MVDITKIPIEGKMKEKFISFFKDRDLNTYHVGDFMKLESGGTCEICGHPIIWGFVNFVHEFHSLGICCGTNVLALQKLKGDFDELNFQRQVSLEKSTIYKRQKEFEKKQIALDFEVKYNAEFNFCMNVLREAANNPVLAEHDIVTIVTEPIPFRLNQPCYLPEKFREPIQVIQQCHSFLYWLHEGVVKDFYLEKLHNVMKKTPEQIINEIIEESKKIQEVIDKDRTVYLDAYHKACDVLNSKPKSMTQYESTMLIDLKAWYENRNILTPKQIAVIKRIHDKYKDELKEW